MTCLLYTSDPYLIYSGSTNTAYMYYLKSAYNTALKYIQEAEFTMVQNDFYDQSNVYNPVSYTHLDVYKRQII